jgi:glycine/D-amino acid oxidase-like deaminating enzyme
VSSDRLPVVGSVEAGLVVNLAHGSHGTATAPLAAACVVEMLGGDFAPIERDGLALLDPSRFRARQARRGPRHGAS